MLDRIEYICESFEDMAYIITDKEYMEIAESYATTFNALQSIYESADGEKKSKLKKILLGALIGAGIVGAGAGAYKYNTDYGFRDQVKHNLTPPSKKRSSIERAKDLVKHVATNPNDMTEDQIKKHIERITNQRSKEDITAIEKMAVDKVLDELKK